MRPVEILERFQWLCREAESCRRMSERMYLIAAPSDVGSVPMTGMPRGTNYPLAAKEQSLLGYAARLAEMAEEISLITAQFEGVLASIRDDRARTVCRMYYGQGLTDEAIAAQVHLETRTVNGIRNDTLRSL